MASFPKLIPAFTAKVAIQPPTPVGPTAITPSLTHVPFLESAGSIVSEPNYAIALDAPILHGADFIRADHDGRNVRLEVQSLARDNKTGGLVAFKYTGVVSMTGAAGKVLRGEADAATTSFGEAFSNVVFETGHPELAAIGNKVYVGSGRFVLEPGKPVIVEYKISEVAA